MLASLLETLLSSAIAIAMGHGVARNLRLLLVRLTSDDDVAEARLGLELWAA